jgi:outer membrane receptor for ferrienterochelin and colicins
MMLDRLRVLSLSCGLLLLLMMTPGHALAQNGTLAGRVTAEESGAPIGAVVVQVVTGSGQVVRSALSNASGLFAISGIAPGSYTVMAAMTGRESVRTANVRVGAGETTTLNVVMRAQALELNPLVVSASKRVERALEAPARVEVVGEREIAERPTVSPVDHLRAVPGIDIAQSGVQSSNVVARGFNNVFSGSIHALTDHRIAGVPSLRVNLMHMVPATNEDLERMEVVLGPGAALYGPNTANGVLHMMTRSPLTYTGTTATIAGGEQNLMHATARSAHRVGQNFGIKVSGQVLQAKEWQYTDPAEAAEQAKFAGNLPFWRQDLMRAVGIDQAEADSRIERIGARDFDVFRWSGEVRADWQATSMLRTVFSVGTTTTNGIELTGLGASQTEDWRYTYYQARANAGRAFAQVYLNTSDAGGTFLLRNGAPIIDRSKLLVAQLQHGASLGTRQNFTYGVDYLFTMPETEGSINGKYENDDQTRELGGYIQSETSLTPRFTLVLAGRVDNHSALPEPVFSPRAAVVFTPATDHAFRLTFNRAFSTPSSLNQFLDLGSAIPNAQLAQLGYSLRVQGTGRDGFRFGQPGAYQMRSPFTPAPLGGPGQLLPANAATAFPLAVGVLAARAAQGGTPLPGPLVSYLSGLRPNAEQVGLNYLNPANNQSGSLASLTIPDLAPIRESTSNTLEAGYKGILGRRLLLAADVWFERKQNMVTPLTIQTPLLLLNGPQLGAYLVPRFMADLGYTQAQAQALAAQLIGNAENPGLATIPVGVISSADVNANGGQLLMTYTNVDDELDLFGTDLSATALLGDQWTLGVAASLVNKDVFDTREGQSVTLNAPKRKGSATLGYRNDALGLTGEGRVRHMAGYPVRSGVYVGTTCLGDTSALAEACVEPFTLVDLSLGYTLPRVRGATLNLTVQNLLDDDYRSFPGVPSIGRMAILRLKYDF